LTISDRNHLGWAMNLCMGLFYIIKEMPGALLLGRFGTLDREPLRIRPFSAALTGPVAVLVGRGGVREAGGPNEDSAGVADARQSRSDPDQRWNRGCDGEEDETAITALPWTTSGSAERRELLEAASRSVEGDQDALSVLSEDTLALLEHLKERPIRVAWDPSPQAGWCRLDGTRSRRQCGPAREERDECRPQRGAGNRPVWSGSVTADILKSAYREDLWMRCNLSRSQVQIRELLGDIMMKSHYLRSL
jgi:hypothetical protein